MRTLAVLGILAGAGLVTICLVMASFLENLDLYVSYMAGDLSPLVVGELHLFFFDPEAWGIGTSYFRLHLGSLINGWAGILMLVVGAGLMHLVGRSRQGTPAVFGVCAMLAGTIPYCIGTLVLAINTEPTKAGYWLHFMICGLVYSAGLCICACLAQLWLGQHQSSQPSANQSPLDLQTAPASPIPQSSR